jgi:hypothetical protein
MLVKKVRFSSENLRELWEAIEEHLGREIRVYREDKNYIYLQIEVEGVWTPWEDPNGGRIEKVTISTEAPCGGKEYWAWERDMMVIDVKEMNTLIDGQELI